MREEHRAHAEELDWPARQPTGLPGSRDILIAGPRAHTYVIHRTTGKSHNTNVNITIPPLKEPTTGITGLNSGQHPAPAAAQVAGQPGAQAIQVTGQAAEIAAGLQEGPPQALCIIITYKFN